ncbi:MAG: thioredoxin fold domain-containing protein [Bacteroidales bacterium]|nr:thioredoxin fold domain-containing protein [Bacteroidales bacterium]
MKKILLITGLLLFGMLGSLHAQCVEGFSRYNITVKNLPFEGKAYLRGSYLDSYQLIDSAVIKKGTAKFKSKSRWVPQGLYTIVSEDHRFRCPVDLISDKGTYTLIWPSDAKESVNVLGKKDGENTAELHRFIQQMNTGNVFLQDLEVALETSPDAYLNHIKAILCFSHYKQTVDISFFSRWLRYYDMHRAYSLHVSPYLFRTIAEYLSDYDVTLEEKWAVVDTVLSHCDCATLDPLIEFIFTTIEDQRDPYYDPLLVHLYDDYGHDWIREDRARLVWRKMDRARKIIPGAKIPELVSHDIEGKAHSTKDITTRYTVLWFWDPDCDHCQVMTPQLHEMYQRMDTIADFEVFAVEVNEDFDRWKAFSDEHQLWDWINLSTSMGEANLDFIEYFDIMTTPVIFLIDNQTSAIIARQITLEELETFLKQHPKN